MKNSPSLRFFFLKKIMQLLLITIVCVLLKKLNIQPGEMSAEQLKPKGSMLSQTSTLPPLKKYIKPELLKFPASAFNNTTNPMNAFNPLGVHTDPVLNTILWKEYMNFNVRTVSNEPMNDL